MVLELLHTPQPPIGGFFYTNKMKRNELQTPLSVFEPNPNRGGEFLVSLFGPELAYTFISELAQKKDALTPECSSVFSDTYFKNIHDYFPSIPVELLGNPLLRKEHIDKANQTVEYLRKLCFPGTRHEMALHNSTTYASLNAAERLTKILTNGTVDERLKYELLRQEVLMLTSLAYTEARHRDHTNERLKAVNNLFEDKLFLGRYGSLSRYECFSLHEAVTNEVLACTNKQTDFDGFDSETMLLKSHQLQVRHIADVGPVMVQEREKRTESALVKAIHKGSQHEGKYIDLKEITDPSGFLFVTEGEKQALLCEKIKAILLHVYPEAHIMDDHHVDTNRGQSSVITFLRLQLFLSPDTEFPIEIMVFDQREYFNYLYHIGNAVEPIGSYVYPNAAAHKLYEIRRANTVADMLFPKEIYDFDPSEIAVKRRLEEEKVAEELKIRNTISRLPSVYRSV